MHMSTTSGGQVGGPCPLDDTWTISLSNRRWVEFPRCPSPRTRHGMIMVSDWKHSQSAVKTSWFNCLVYWSHPCTRHHQHGDALCTTSTQWVCMKVCVSAMEAVLSVNKLLWGCLYVARLLETQDDSIVGNHKGMYVWLIDGAIFVSLCVCMPVIITLY